jgi:hypothetical protein
MFLPQLVVSARGGGELQPRIVQRGLRPLAIPQQRIDRIEYIVKLALDLLDVAESKLDRFKLVAQSLITLPDRIESVGRAGLEQSKRGAGFRRLTRRLPVRAVSQLTLFIGLVSRVDPVTLKMFRNIIGGGQSIAEEFVPNITHNNSPATGPTKRYKANVSG